MADSILMPRQGNTVESCVVMKWRVNEGDVVTAKTVVCEVETDKASFEVVSGFDGVLLKRLFAEGDDVPVTTPIAYVGQPGEKVEGLAARSDAPKATQAVPQSKTALQTVPFAEGAPSRGDAVSPRARRLAESRGVDPSRLNGSGPGGRVVERDVQAALSGLAPATRAALDAARQTGVGLPAQGSGLGGRVLSTDLGSPGSSSLSPSNASASATENAPFPGPFQETKLKGVRKLVAERMLASVSTTAQFTLNASANAVRLQQLRSRFKSSEPARGLSGITINDIVLYATAKVLKRFREFNAHFVDDTISTFERVHLGVACDTPRGLLVPVIRDADALSLKRLSEETKRLVEAARSGSVQPDELGGSTFTVTNLGALGVESFTPVLNVPEVAILGVCAIVPKAFLKNGTTVFEPGLGLSLTINHQVVDGAPAARFLQELTAALAECDLLLAE